MRKVNPQEAKAELKERAAALGLSPVGVAEVPLDLRRQYFLQWRAEGRHGGMDWMARDPERRANPERILPEARCVLCFGLNYYQPGPSRPGRIAKYALGKDYQTVLTGKL